MINFFECIYVAFILFFFRLNHFHSIYNRDVNEKFILYVFCPPN